MQYSQELKSHIEKLHASGKNFSQLVVALSIERGYTQHVARRIVETVLDFGGNDYRMVEAVDLQGTAVPDIDTGGQRTTIRVADKDVGVVFEQVNPRIVLLENFLSDDECDAIRQMASSHLTAATVHYDDHGDGTLLKDVRDCDVAGLGPTHAPVITTVERRIHALTAWPPSHGEPLQVQRYRQGGKFEPHFDFFLENTRYYDNELKSGGQRIATLLMYLQPPESGGATYFENLGMRVVPRKGSAIFFSYSDAAMQGGTLHAGDPVISGEKWIMTKWFREKEIELEAAEVETETARA